MLLAYPPDEVRSHVISQLPKITPLTVVYEGVMRARLAKVRHEGYATAGEEMTLGACFVAVPVFHVNTVVAALGVVVSSRRRDTMRLVSALHVATQAIPLNLPELLSNRDFHAFV